MKCLTHFKVIQWASQPCWDLQYNKMLLCRLWSVLGCNTKLILIRPIRYNFTWSEYTPRLFTWVSSATHSSRLIFCSFSNDASVDICLRSGCFWSRCPPCFPFVSLWSALWMTSTLVRSAALCSALWWVGFFYIPEGTASYSLVLIYGPATQQSSILLIQHAQHFQTYSSLCRGGKVQILHVCVCIKWRVVLVWAV